MSPREEGMRYGEGNRGFAMLTLPDETAGAPILVMLNAGLLHRSEPYRLNVLVARQLAEQGYICARVDLSGKGDTPSRPNLRNRESVALDWQHLGQSLERRFGHRHLLIMGLCSGADNGIKLAAMDERVKGLVLLDPVSPKDARFAVRRSWARLTNWHQWARLPSTLCKRLASIATRNPPAPMLRDLPYPEDLERCFASLIRQDGRVLMVFTSHALTEYNRQGQFCRAVAMHGLDRICEEVFWPHVMHLYNVQAHREELIATIKRWAVVNYPRFVRTTA